jgi:cell division protein FtsQ
VRKNRRRGARPWIAVAGRVARVTSGVLALGAMALATLHVLGWIEAHPYFAVREIDVEAPGRLDANTIVGWAGLTAGMSVWDVSARRAEERLVAHPRIRTASVERRLPDQVTIRVEERQPVAILFGPQPLLVGGDGAAFPPSDGEVIEGLPYVTGLVGKDPFSAAVTERLRQAAQVVALWHTQERLPLISEVRPEADELVVFIVGTPLAVRFGRQARADDLTRLGTLLDLWRGREAQVASIDLSLPGEAVVRLRGAKRPGTSRGALQDASERRHSLSTGAARTALSNGRVSVT